eukprot:3625285-Rhodomonas_salina.1
MPVYLVAEVTPSVRIRPTVGVLQPDGAVRFNAVDGIVLAGECSESGALAWACEPPLPDSPSGIPFGYDEANFKVSPESGILTAQQYTVTLTCTVKGSVGKAMVDLVRNDPPRGGQCEACLVRNCKVGTPGCDCIKEGVAVDDLFSFECKNWADEHDPLEFRLGLAFESSLGEVETMWFQWSRLPLFYHRSPSGTLRFIGQVRDRAGAVSPIIQDLVTVVSAGNARRAASIFGGGVERWDAGDKRLGGVRGLSQIQSATLTTWTPLVEALLQKKDGEEAVKLVSTLALESDELLARGAIQRADAIEI